MDDLININSPEIPDRPLENLPDHQLEELHKLFLQDYTDFLNRFDRKFALDKLNSEFKEIAIVSPWGQEHYLSGSGSGSGINTNSSVEIITVAYETVMDELRIRQELKNLELERRVSYFKNNPDSIPESFKNAIGELL